MHPERAVKTFCPLLIVVARIMMMRANTRFLLVTRRYTVLELSLFILSDSVRPTVIAETKLRARIYARGSLDRRRVSVRNCLRSCVFQFFAFCK